MTTKLRQHKLLLTDLYWDIQANRSCAYLQNATES
ncbi:hypothetical protein TSMEX_005992 [Taenia solium]|eukprot:TsM_000149900 transcript=TsM_000149900 gene=TsM_000149900